MAFTNLVWACAYKLFGSPCVTLQVCATIPPPQHAPAPTMRVAQFMMLCITFCLQVVVDALKPVTRFLQRVPGHKTIVRSLSTILSVAAMTPAQQKPQHGVFSWLLGGGGDAASRAKEIVQEVNRSSLRGRHMPSSSAQRQIDELNEFEKLSSLPTGYTEQSQQPPCKVVVCGFMDGYDPLAAATRASSKKAGSYYRRTTALEGWPRA